MIAVGGENLIDLVSISSEDGPPVYTAYPGGSPFNVALAAGRQGAPACYLTPVSCDRLGDLLQAKLTECGVQLVGGRSDKPTSLAVVSVQDGSPSYGFYRQDTAERQVSSAFLDSVMPDDATIFHLGSAALIDGADAQAWEEAFATWSQSGKLTSLDPNIRPSLVSDADHYRKRIRRMSAVTDILKLSDEDLLWLYPDHGFEAGCSACFADSNAALTVITRGADGAKAKWGERVFDLPAFPVGTLVDTVGAGDTFMATLLVWFAVHNVTTRSDIDNLREQQCEQALQRSSVAAALNCRKQGCQPPTAAEINDASA